MCVRVGGWVDGCGWVWVWVGGWVGRWVQTGQEVLKGRCIYMYLYSLAHGEFQVKLSEPQLREIATVTQCAYKTKQANNNQTNSNHMRMHTNMRMCAYAYMCKHWATNYSIIPLKLRVCKPQILPTA